MNMICRKCKREMSCKQLIGQLGEHFLRLTLPRELASCLAQAAKNYFLTPKRGLTDEMMAGACNGLQTECPQCKKFECWDPCPVIANCQKKVAQSQALQ